MLGGWSNAVPVAHLERKMHKSVPAHLQQSRPRVSCEKPAAIHNPQRLAINGWEPSPEMVGLWHRVYYINPFKETVMLSYLYLKQVPRLQWFRFQAFLMKPKTAGFQFRIIKSISASPTIRTWKVTGTEWTSFVPGSKRWGVLKWGFP